MENFFNILHYPHPLLLKPTQQVSEFNDHLKMIVNKMFCTMYHFRGIGLAANQVGISKSFFIMDISGGQDKIVCINPKIIEKTGKMTFQECCLSFPDKTFTIKRASKICVEYYDVLGDIYQDTFVGIAAICFQHEFDHLLGLTIMDHINNK